MDCSPPGSSIHGIFQARILECFAIAILQGIFLTQGSSLGLPRRRQALYRLSHQGSPYVLRQPQPRSSSRAPLSPSPCLHISSLRLHLYSCPTNRLISTIFLHSIHVP